MQDKKVKLSELPKFKYFPDPLKAGSIKASNNECCCCKQQRGFIYTLSPYCAQELTEDSICPWCIADGSAAAELDCRFNDLCDASISSEVMAEINLRTPEFLSWQTPDWLVHCQDACIYLGEAEPADMLTMPLEQQELLQRCYKMTPEAWLNFIKMGEVGDRLDDISVHKFMCSKCHKMLFDIYFP